MARSLDQIRLDQDRLEQATTQINAQLADVYEQYLQILGGAVQHQLILGTYHLCTQTYPEAFLKLSLSQREKLQKDMRQLGHKGKTHIKELAHVDNMATTLKLLLQSRSLGGTLADLGKHEKTLVDPETAAQDPSEPEDTASPDSDTRLTATVEPAEIAPQSILLLSSQTSQPFDGKAVPPMDEDVQASDAAETESAAEADIAPSGSSTPDIATNIALPPETQPRVEALSPLKLAKRHVLLERQIRAVLHSLSNLANHALQQAQILPDLPEAVLTAATEAEADEQAPSVPNLLNVIVEIGGDRPDDTDSSDALEEESLETELEAPERTMTHLVAINLRLADIEFTDTRTALWRSKIQEILRQLKKLSRHYQKLQQERAQAEAEAAWRAVWFEESDR